MRPSSQTIPIASGLQRSIETNPCSLSVPSRWGTTEPPHVAPPSRDVARWTSYANRPFPLLTSQWAKRVPSGSDAIDGKSAQLTNQSGPSAIVRAADQRLPSEYVANRSACRFSPAGSIQVRWVRPSGATVRLGSPLPGPAGDWSGRTAIRGAAGGERRHAAGDTARTQRSHPPRRNSTARVVGDTQP